MRTWFFRTVLRRWGSPLNADMHESVRARNAEDSFRKVSDDFSNRVKLKAMRFFVDIQKS